VLARARERLDLAVYEVGPSFAPLLIAAAVRGVAVRLLVDGHPGANATTARRLLGGHTEVRVWRRRRGAEAHWKLLVAGPATVAVGSGNLIARDAPRDPAGRLPPPDDEAAPGTREWWVIVEDAPGLARHARAAQEAAWAEARRPPASWRAPAAVTVPPVGVPHPLAAPLSLEVAGPALELVTGGAAVAALLGRRLAGARRRALCTVPYVHVAVPAVRELLDALAAAAGQGADARLLLGAVPAVEELAALRARGLPVRVMDPARSTTGHAKGAVADAAAVVGSANWSRAGLGVNLEAALAVDVPAAGDYYAAAFERDWAVST
jgi:cardiolipin synthase A/B